MSGTDIALQPGTANGTTPRLTPEQEALVLSQGARALVKHYARQFALSGRTEDYQDFLMAGYTGLIEAVRKFDPARMVHGKPARFSSYAEIYVLRHIEEVKQQESLASIHAQDYVARLWREGHDPTTPEITLEDMRQAQKLKMRPDTVCRQRREIAEGRDRPSSLDVTITGRGMPPETRGDHLEASGPGPEEAALAGIVRTDIAAALSSLSQDVRDAVCRMVFEGQTERQIARSRRVSLETATAWISEGCASLRARLSHLAPPIAGKRETDLP